MNHLGECMKVGFVAAVILAGMLSGMAAFVAGFVAMAQSNWLNRLPTWLQWGIMAVYLFLMIFLVGTLICMGVK
jgi:hypothetical protein